MERPDHPPRAHRVETLVALALLPLTVLVTIWWGTRTVDDRIESGPLPEISAEVGARLVEIRQTTNVTKRVQLTTALVEDHAWDDVVRGAAELLLLTRGRAATFGIPAAVPVPPWSVRRHGGRGVQDDTSSLVSLHRRTRIALAARPWTSPTSDEGEDFVWKVAFRGTFGDAVLFRSLVSTGRSPADALATIVANDLPSPTLAKLVTLPVLDELASRAVEPDLAYEERGPYVAVLAHLADVDVSAPALDRASERESFAEHWRAVRDAPVAEGLRLRGYPDDEGELLAAGGLGTGASDAQILAAMERSTGYAEVLALVLSLRHADDASIPFTLRWSRGRVDVAAWRDALDVPRRPSRLRFARLLPATGGAWHEASVPLHGRTSLSKPVFPRTNDHTAALTWRARAPGRDGAAAKGDVSVGELVATEPGDDSAIVVVEGAPLTRRCLLPNVIDPGTGRIRAEVHGDPRTGAVVWVEDAAEPPAPVDVALREALASIEPSQTTVESLGAAELLADPDLIPWLRSVHDVSYPVTDFPLVEALRSARVACRDPRLGALESTAPIDDWTWVRILARSDDPSERQEAVRAFAWTDDLDACAAALFEIERRDDELDPRDVAKVRSLGAAAPAAPWTAMLWKARGVAAAVLLTAAYGLLLIVFGRRRATPPALAVLLGLVVVSVTALVDRIDLADDALGYAIAALGAAALAGRCSAWGWASAAGFVLASLASCLTAPGADNGWELVATTGALVGTLALAPLGAAVVRPHDPAPLPPRRAGAHRGAVLMTATTTIALVAVVAWTAFRVSDIAGHAPWWMPEVVEPTALLVAGAMAVAFAVMLVGMGVRSPTLRLRPLPVLFVLAYATPLVVLLTTELLPGVTWSRPAVRWMLRPEAELLIHTVQLAAVAWVVLRLVAAARGADRRALGTGTCDPLV